MDHWEIPRLERQGSAKPIAFAIGINIGVEIGKRKAATISNPIMTPIPILNPMMLFKPL